MKRVAGTEAKRWLIVVRVIVVLHLFVFCWAGGDTLPLFGAAVAAWLILEAHVARQEQP